MLGQDSGLPAPQCFDPEMSPHVADVWKQQRRPAVLQDRAQAPSVSPTVSLTWKEKSGVFLATRLPSSPVLVWVWFCLFSRGQQACVAGVALPRAACDDPR